jgi:hypothetical protein
VLGHLDLQRPYFHCKHCHQGHVPLDKILGLTDAKLTPAASEVACIAGVQSSFAQVAEVTLKKLCGLNLSESTVERVTESTGERLAELLRKKIRFGEDEPWHWQLDAQGKRCAYVSLDATGVRQQGLRGARADGRMAYVAMIYNPRSPHDPESPPPHQVRYLSGFYDFTELGSQLRRQAAQVGWDGAEQQIALSDGGNGLENFLRVHFPRAECILDFWHAKEHLVELAQALWPADQPKQKAWLDEQCPRLKHEGGAAVLSVLESMSLDNVTSAAREAHREHLGYFQNHVHRMDYPRYVANGWQIGSGPVESACKTVVGNRLKGSGMRWGAPGTDGVCHLRALFLSEPTQWNCFWRDHRN